jgi:hypothetical protein
MDPRVKPAGDASVAVSRAQRSTSRAFTPVFAGYGGALQTPISGLPEIGAQMRASRVNPTCVDRYGP